MKAARTGKRNQKMSNLSINELQLLTDKQEEFYESYKQGFNVFAYGSPGTGKTYLALYAALEDLFAKNISRIVIVRSAVPVRDQGFLPGTLEEKEAPMTVAYRKIVSEICSSGTAYEELVKKGQLVFTTTSFVRSITLDNCAIILDEIQNYNWQECVAVLTRPGLDSRVIICGDGRQNDLVYKKNDSTGLYNLMRVTERMENQFALVEFGHDDIVRSGFVKDFIIACEELNL